MPLVHSLSAVQVGFPAVLLIAAVCQATPPSLAKKLSLDRAVNVVRVARWITREHLTILGVGSLIMSLTLLAVHVVSHTTVGFGNGDGDELANDFINFWSGAQIAANGQANLAYDTKWFQAYEQAITGPSSSFRIYNYPPVAMLLSLPLACFSFVPALALWTLIGAGLCFWVLRRLVGSRVAALMAVGAPAAYLNLLSGQNGGFTAGLFAGGLMILERRPVMAGICFGCLAYKPHLGLLLPLALAASGKWRTIAAAAATVAALVLASFALFGTATWTAFLEEMAGQMHLLGWNWPSWHRIPTVFVSLLVLGATTPVAYAAQIVSGLFAAALAVMVWRSPAPIETKAAVLTVGTFLATPYAWDYDMVLLMFAAAWLGCEGLRTGFLAWERIAVVALLVLPLVTMMMTKLMVIPLGPAILWLVFLVLVRRGCGLPVSAHAKLKVS
jgi:arabinofuranan 3-O-arabinosyltransferase